MKRKLILSSLVVATAAAIAGGGTFAVFSDTEISGSQSVAAGTLDLAVSGDSSFTISNAKPGDSYSKSIKVSNKGSLPGTWTGFFTKTADDENGCTEPEVPAVSDGADDGIPAEPGCATDLDAYGSPLPQDPLDGELDDLMQVVVKVDGVRVYPPTGTAPASHLDWLYVGNEVPIAAGSEAEITLDFTWPSGLNDNQAQSDSFSLQLHTTLVQ